MTIKMDCYDSSETIIAVDNTKGDVQFAGDTISTVNRNHPHFSRGTGPSIECGTQERKSAAAKFLCQVCNESLSSFYNLHLHLKKTHKATIKLTCNLCGKTFHKNRELINHLETHQNDPEKSHSTSKSKLNKTKRKKAVSGSKPKPKAKRAKRTRKNKTKTEEKPTSFTKGKRKGGATLKEQPNKSKIDETTKISLPPSVDSDKSNDVCIDEPSKEISKYHILSPPPPSPPPVLSPQISNVGDDWGWDTDPQLPQPETSTTLELHQSPVSSSLSVPVTPPPPPAPDLPGNSALEDYFQPLSPKLEVFDDLIDDVNLEEDLLASHSVETSLPPSTVSENSSSFPFHCSKCDLQFQTKDLLQIHQTFHNLLIQVKFRCEVPSCFQYFDDAVEYQRHFTSSHTNNRNQRSAKRQCNARRRKTTIPCKYCSKKSRTKSEAILHDATHSKATLENPKKSNAEAVRKPQKINFADEDSELEDPAEDPLILIESIPESDVESEVVGMTSDPDQVLEEDAMETHSNSGNFDDANSVEESGTKPNLGNSALEWSVDVIHGICKLTTHDCRNCNKTFYSDSALEEHVTVHLGDNLLSCPKCVLKFTTECVLEKHCKSDHLKAEGETANVTAAETKRQKNGEEQPPQPENTGNLKPPPKTKQFPSPSRTSRGVKRSTDTFCSDCRKTCANPRELAIHLKEHSGIELLSCPNCDQQFGTQCSLERHLKSEHDSSADETVLKPFSCPQCGRKYLKRKSMRDHLRNVHSALKSFTCPQCPGRLFCSKYALQAHLPSHSSEQPFVCPTCTAAFKRESDMKDHMKRHTGIKSYACSVASCSMAFTSSSELRYHKRKMHRNQNRSEVDKTVVFCPESPTKVFGAEEPFSCSQCPGRLFCTKSALKTHLSTHRCEQPFVCPTCAIAFKRESDLKEHVKRHTGIKSYACSVVNCSMAFTSSSELRYHRRKIHRSHGSTAHAPLDHKCELCDELYHSYYDYSVHVKNVHSGDRPGSESDGIVAPTPEIRRIPYACDLCAASFLTRLGWARHKLGHPDNADVLCHFCGGQFPTAEDLESHKKLDHSNAKGQRKKRERMICHICGKSMSSASQIRKHMERHNEAQLICDECGKPFKTGSELQLHKNTHLAEKPFKCKFCPYRYNTPSLVYPHMHYHHTGPGDSGFVESPLSADLERNFPCDLDGCSQSFTSLPGLEQHQLYHTGEKKASCKKCGEKFVTIFDAYVHKTVLHKKQQNQTQHECQYCQKSCINKTTLDSHIRYNHTLEEPFPCTAPGCDRKFKGKSDLKYHTVVAHTREYKFECDVCGKKVATRGNYNTHMRIHTGIRVFRCEEEGCEASFKAASLLKKHLYKEHGRTDLAAEVRDWRWGRKRQ